MAAPKLKYSIGNSASTNGTPGVTNTDTSFPLTSTTNFQAKSGAGMVLLDEGQPTEELGYSTAEAGGALSIPLANRGLEGGSAQAHSSGYTVRGIFSAGMWNDLIDSVKNILDATTGAVKSFSMPSAGSINDSNGNELLKFPSSVSAAVNEVTVTNAATGTNPIVAATGTDSNVGLDFKMKGTGKYRRPTIVELPVGSAAASLATGDGQAFFRVPEELNGMNLTGVAAAVYTAGTTGTMDVQIRNKTQAADILSTKITIDSTETDTSTAAAPAVINASEDDVTTGDIIAVDVDVVQTTPAKGLIVSLRFELP